MLEQSASQTTMKLIIEDDEGRRSVVPIDLGEATVGRDEDNTIRLNERNVSRHHAKIARENGQVVAWDLDSYNGVYVNGDRVRQRQDIHEGDVLRVGDFQLELRGEGLARRSEETTQRAGPPEDLETTKPSIRLDESTGEVVSEARQEATAIIRPEQMSSDPRRRETEALSGARARLICVSTQFAGREFEIDREEAVIGRTEDNDIAVDHRSVSRHHAKILVSGSSYRIIDMKSANGTLVNGEEYAQIELKSGDLIELGHVKLRFVPPGEHYSLTSEERAAVTDQPAYGSSVAEPAPVAEYVPPRDVTNPELKPEFPVAEARSSRGLVLAGVALIAAAIGVIAYILSDSGDAEDLDASAKAASLEAQGPDAIRDLADRMTDALVDKDWDQADQIADTILILDAEHTRAKKVKNLATMELDARRAYDRGVKLSMEKKWQEALDALSEVDRDSDIASEAASARQKAKTSMKADELYRQAQTALEEKRLDEAQNLANELTALDPERASAILAELGGRPRPRNSRSGKNTSSKSSSAESSEPSLPVTAPPPSEDDKTSEAKRYLAEAVALIKAEQPKAALAPLQACIQAKAKYCRCYRALGIAHAKLRNSAKAERNYRSYIELCPNAKDAEQVRTMLGD